MRKLVAIFVCFFAFSLAAHAQGVPASAGSAYHEDWSGASYSTFPATHGTGAGGTGVDVTAGEVALCWASAGSNGYSACTDAAGNTCTLLTGSEIPSTGGSKNGGWSECLITVAATSDVFSCNYSASHAYVACLVHVYSKSSGPWTLDVQSAYSSVMQSGTTSANLGSSVFSTDSPTEAIDCAWNYNTNGGSYTAGAIGGISATLGPTSAGSTSGNSGDEYVITSSILTGAGASITLSSTGFSQIQGSCVSVSSVALGPPILSVNASTGNHAISPLIYGMGGIPPNPTSLDPTFAAKIGLPLVRWGGDLATNYNWNVDTSNAGNDYYFVGGGGGTPTPGAQPDSMISTYRAINPSVQFLVTIPIGGYVTLSTAAACSYRESVYGVEDLELSGYLAGDSCGDGSSGGVAVADTNLSYNYTSNSTTSEKAWITHLISKWGSSTNGGVAYYQLDNEPGGWCNTHHDWNSATCTSYSVIEPDGETYGAAIKSLDPNAKVLGPSDYELYGWTGNSPTSDPSVVYYLKQMAAYQSAHGTRLLDYLDEHYQVGDNTSGSIQSDFDQVRTWWDPTYNYQNNVFGPFSNLGLGPQIELIPRMQAYIAAYYPGTQFTISEYEVSHFTNGSWPKIGGSSLIDALVEADALGVFGYNDLQMAALFDHVASTDPEAFSFYLYRNYDGAGGQFGNTSVTSISTDPTKLSVYGALRSSDGKMTVIVINKESISYPTSLTLAGFTATSSAATYTYSNANTGAIASGTAPVTGGNSVSYTFPAYSATEFVFTPSGTGTMTVVPPTNVLATVVQ